MYTKINIIFKQITDKQMTDNANILDYGVRFSFVFPLLFCHCLQYQKLQ